MRHLKSSFNFPTALAVSHTTCKQVLFEQLAKILSGGRSGPNCGFNAKAPGTSDAKILPKGCQLRSAQR